MNAPYPAARVIALYTLLAPVLFGFGVGLPLGVLMLPVVLASLLYGFLPALAGGIWLAAWRTRGTLWGRLHAAGLCVAVAMGETLWLDNSVAQSDWLAWTALAGVLAAAMAAWCFLPAPLVPPAEKEWRDETA